MTAVLRDQVKIIYLSIFKTLFFYFYFYFYFCFYQGIDAQYVSLEDIVPPCNRDLEFDETLSQDFYDDLAITLGARLKECAPRVPVVTGKFSCNSFVFKKEEFSFSFIVSCRFFWSCSRISTSPSWSRLH